MEPPAWAFLVSLVVNLAAAAADFDYAHTFPGHKIAPRPAKTGGGANFAAVSRRRKYIGPSQPPIPQPVQHFRRPVRFGGARGQGASRPRQLISRRPRGQLQNFTKSTNFATVPRRRKIFLLHIRHHTDTSAPWTAPRAILGGNGRLLKKIPVCTPPPTHHPAAR